MVDEGGGGGDGSLPPDPLSMAWTGWAWLMDGEWIGWSLDTVAAAAGGWSLTARLKYASNQA